MKRGQFGTRTIWHSRQFGKLSAVPNWPRCQIDRGAKSSAVLNCPVPNWSVPNFLRCQIVHCPVPKCSLGYNRFDQDSWQESILPPRQYMTIYDCREVQYMLWLPSSTYLTSIRLYWGRHSQVQAILKRVIVIIIWCFVTIIIMANQYICVGRPSTNRVKL